MKAKATLALIVGCLCLLLAAPATAGAAFGLNGFDVSFEKEGAAATGAGSHPDSMTVSFGVNYSGEGTDAKPDGEIKDAVFEFLAGLAINPTATPRCPTAAFLAEECPDETRVGEVNVAVNVPTGVDQADVFNIDPPPGSAARLGFVLLGVPVVTDGGLKASPDYNVIGSLRNTRQVLKVFSASLTLFGVTGEEPFLTLPTSCTGPAKSTYRAASWQGQSDEGSAFTHDGSGNPQGFVGCDKLPFSPKAFSARPSADSAESPSGLDLAIDFDQQGLTSATGSAQSTLKAVSIALPEGVTANPSLAEGLGVCSQEDLGRETLAAAPGQGCPEDSKVGTVGVQTPLLEQTIPGSVFIATPDDPATAAPENPFDSLIALYIVLKDPVLGVLVKVPVKVEPDPVSGQLIGTAANLPQVPFSHFAFHFREGQRAPLITPARCGTYTTVAEMTPWARPAESLSVSSSFGVTRGVGGGPCPPGGVPPFAPGFQAGSLNNNAGAYSPFVMRLTRQDAEQDMTRFSATLPPGVTGKLAGVDKCSEAKIALAKAKTGKAERSSPSCPANSLIGHTLAGAGVGGALTYVPGSLYLAGPYHGDPLSVVAITPALAGPFDAGTVVVRVALEVDPVTAEVSVDGAASDPIPHILKGIVLKVRELRVLADRPDFTLNPTGCAPAATGATLWGSYLDVLNPADDRPVSLSDRFQAASCQSLGFKPRLAMRLKGGTHRGDHPALQAVLRPRPGNANIAGAVVTLPRSAFLDQAHIRTICTRVQFAAGAGNGAGCPAGAVYGQATAWSPLLDEPLEGPVFLRSSSHNLPDLVIALHGLLDISLASRIDSFKGGIRSSFESIPDAPVSKFVLEMQGGKKGLIVNSTNLCASTNRAKARFVGQNGKAYESKPVLRAKCPKHHKGKARHKRHRGKRAALRHRRAAR